MGRVKTRMIKRTSRELLKKHDSFTSDFEYNKKVLKNALPSKKVRNQIAGYISRIKKTNLEIK